jgi:hypothetical protein
MAARVRALIDFLVEKRDQPVAREADGVFQERGQRLTGRAIK